LEVVAVVVALNFESWQVCTKKQSEAQNSTNQKKNV
jgi:hypothetical protein